MLQARADIEAAAEQQVQAAHDEVKTVTAKHDSLTAKLASRCDYRLALQLCSSSSKLF